MGTWSALSFLPCVYVRQNKRKKQHRFVLNNLYLNKLSKRLNKKKKSIILHRLVYASSRTEKFKYKLAGESGSWHDQRTSPLLSKSWKKKVLWKCISENKKKKKKYRVKRNVKKMATKQMNGRMYGERRRESFYGCKKRKGFSVLLLCIK